MQAHTRITLYSKYNRYQLLCGITGVILTGETCLRLLNSLILTNQFMMKCERIYIYFISPWAAIVKKIKAEKYKHTKTQKQTRKSKRTNKLLKKHLYLQTNIYVSIQFHFIPELFVSAKNSLAPAYVKI